MTFAESHRQHAERLAAEYPHIRTQRILAMMAEEYEMLFGFDPDSSIAPILAEATLERVEMELEKLGIASAS